MRLTVVLIGLALAAAGCGKDDEQAAAPTPSGGTSLAQLTITVDKDGDDGAGKAKTIDLRCEGEGDSAACDALADLKDKAFKPTPGMTACTEQYGGPEVATVKGTLRGKPVDARFSRENGCAIARWNDVSELLKAAG
jgi:hypothetical protein